MLACDGHRPTMKLPETDAIRRTWHAHVAIAVTSIALEP